VPRRILHRLPLLLALLGLVAPLTGCFTLDVPNPSFAQSTDEIWAEWRRLREEPKPLDRPIVVLNGYRGTVLRGLNLGADLRKLTSQERDDFLVISYPLASDIPDVARRVVREVQKRWPTDDPDHTIEVDVVGFSMGGLVGRYAAQDAHLSSCERRLNVRRLFTLATPHRGARSARLALDRAVSQMMPGGMFLSSLDETFVDCGYELIPYAHTNDWIVGARNAAPPGQQPIWTAGTATFSHFTVTTDRRILVDIARRLRGEAPLAMPSEPPSD